jgi:vacuolar-type H+-ATPase subunit E/Vma4
VREAADVADGVRVAAADGRVVVENTLGSRLARARREMVSRVAETLWGR